MKQAGENLRVQQNDSVARLTEVSAEGIDRLAGRLRESDIDDLFGQAEDFARRRPEVVAGVALAAGFVLGQILSDLGEEWTQKPRVFREKTESSLEYHPEENEEAYYERH